MNDAAQGIDKVDRISQGMEVLDFGPNDLREALASPLWDQRIFSNRWSSYTTYRDRIEALGQHPSLLEWAAEIGQDPTQPFIVRRNALEVALINAQFSIYGPAVIIEGESSLPQHPIVLIRTLYAPYIQAAKQQQSMQNSYRTPWLDVLKRQAVPDAVQIKDYDLVCLGLVLKVPWNITEDSAEVIVDVLTHYDAFTGAIKKKNARLLGEVITDKIKVLTDTLERPDDKEGFMRVPVPEWSDCYCRFDNLPQGAKACWHTIPQPARGYWVPRCWIWLTDEHLILGYERRGWVTSHTEGPIVSPFAWLSLEYLPDEPQEISTWLGHIQIIPRCQQVYNAPALPPEALPRCRDCRKSSSFTNNFSLLYWDCMACQARTGRIIY